MPNENSATHRNEVAFGLREPTWDDLCAHLWAQSAPTAPQNPAARAQLLLAYVMARTNRDQEREAIVRRDLSPSSSLTERDQQ
jgi:hypothetical protein